MACVAVSSLVRTIEIEFLQPHPRPILQEKELIIPSNMELIQFLCRKLESLMKLFDEKKMEGDEASKHLERRLRDVAFLVEDEIELQISHLYETEEEKSCPLKLCCILQQAIEDIDAIEEELVKIKNEDKVQGRKTAATLDVLPRSEDDDSSQRASYSENKMVGKDEELEIIKKMLMDHQSKKREVVLIKGMGGIGKTTLARQVYRDSSIAFHFDKRAWCVASQHHNKRQMILALLNSMGYADSSNDVGVLELKLYQCLKYQRYLVVIDDVWSNRAWDDVKACFSDDEYGSRVLLTTRLAEVAKNTCSNNDEFYHEMQLLNQTESWNLFCEKACKSLYVEFQPIGRQINEKCNGLPLAIVMVAGILSKLDKLDEWKCIAESLNSFGTIIDEECSRILSFSYIHLPHNLKACFLYLGVFPEDYEINTNDVAKLWAAEGLVKASEGESFDMLIDKHIQELLDRSLILESKRSCCGSKVKAFTMHDLLHAFCVKEAQEEKLLYIAREHGSNSPQQGFRWVSIQSDDYDIHAVHPSLTNCRSIFYFPFYPSETTTTTLNLQFSKLLRVFYFTSGSICRKIVDLIHLRYLPPAIGHFKISKLSKAWNLQTLYIRVDDKRSYLEFPQLQYFSCFSICRHPPKFVHQNLQSICWLKPHHCTKEFLRNVPCLKKVRICGERSECNDCIENLVYLEQLKKLNINAYEERCTSLDAYEEHGTSLDANEEYGMSLDAYEEHCKSLDIVPIFIHIADLSNLEKLTLRNTNFEWKGVNIISRLPKLKVLKLFFFACVGEEWELTEEVVFGELIYLGINSTDLKHWKAGSDHFHELERLVLYECQELEEIPLDFAEITTLKLIELKGCLPSAVTSAKEIETEQRDGGNDNIVIIEEDTLRTDVFEYEDDDFDELESDED